VTCTAFALLECVKNTIRNGKLRCFITRCNPPFNRKFTVQKPIRLRPKPLLPLVAALAAIARPARWDQVGGDRSATFVAWFYVVKRICWVAAICADVLPCLKDLVAKLLLCTAFWDEARAVNPVVHLDGRAARDINAAAFAWY
jgi:hypothetical protein